MSFDTGNNPAADSNQKVNIMSEQMKCTPYVTIEDGWEDSEPWELLLRCPVCKGWLPRDFPLDKPFICKKCGSELMAFPEFDEDDEEAGKICPIGPKKVEK